jgi:hypothetical protein
MAKRRARMVALTPRHLGLAPGLRSVAHRLQVWGEGRSPFRLPNDVLEDFFRRLQSDKELFYIYEQSEGKPRPQTLAEAVRAMEEHLEAKEGNTVIVRINGSGHEDFRVYFLEFGLGTPGQRSQQLSKVEISSTWDAQTETISS